MKKQGRVMATKFRTAAVLGIVILGAMLLWGFGCSRTNPELSQATGWEGTPWLGIRPASGDSARLLRNAYYLKVMGRPEMALKELEAAYQQDPRNLKVLDSLARNYEEIGEFNRAQKIYQEALAVDPTNQALNNNLSFSYYLSGQYDKAETCFRQSLAQNPQNLMARNNLGLLLCRRGRSEEAYRLWRQAEGEAAAQKKMQQVMVALGQSDPGHYAQTPQAAPMRTAALEKGPLPSRQEAAGPASIPAAVPAAPPAAAAPAPAPREPAKLAPKPAPVAAHYDKTPAAAVAKMQTAPPPGNLAHPPVKAVTRPEAAPERLALKPAPAQAKASPVAAKPKADAAPAKVIAKYRPAAPPVRQAPEALKKTAPAAAPPAPAKEMKTRMAAASASLAKLADYGIEVLNGSPVKKLAHQTRTMLAQEGYRVVSIGNYRDFGAENTIIYYREGAENAAKALNTKFFPQAQLEAGGKFAKGADIQILLGKDLMSPPALAGKALPAAEKVAAGTSAGQPEANTAAAPPAAPPAQSQVQAPASKVAAAAPAPGKAQPAYLTAEELENTAIDIRNGTWTKDLARRARTMLSQEGFFVASIGNHIDFGAEKTIIYYRQGAEKVARNLNSQFFPSSRLEKTEKLPPQVDIKVLLGKDLLGRPEVMARLSD